MLQQIRQCQFQKIEKSQKIICEIRGSELAIRVVKSGQNFICRMSDEDMSQGLKQIFINIYNFYLCFCSICEIWKKTDQNAIKMDQNGALEINFSQKIIKVEVKKKLILKMVPDVEYILPRQMVAQSKNEEDEQKPLEINLLNDFETKLAKVSDIEELKLFLKNFWEINKATNTQVNELKIENNLLKAGLKQMEEQIYKINVKNNNLTRSLNLLTQITTNKFVNLEQILQKIDKDNSSVQTSKSSQPNINKSIKEDSSDLKSKLNEIKGVKWQFEIDRKHPFINRFQLDNNVIVKINADDTNQIVSNKLIPEKGRHYFTVKNIDVPKNYIHIGVLSQKKAGKVSSHFDQLCINYWGGNGCINNQGNQVLVGREFKPGETMKVIIDRDAGLIIWAIEDHQIATASLGELKKKKLVGYIELFYKDSKIEINK